MKTEHKIFCGPSKILINILWPIRICLNYFMTPTKTIWPSLLATLYRKEIDRHSHLYQKSEHPETLKQSIPYSQRLKKICTTEGDFTEHFKALTKWLVERGYNEKEIKQQISKTFMIDRDYLLNQKKQAVSNRIPLILTYNRTLPA